VDAFSRLSYFSQVMMQAFQSLIGTLFFVLHPVFW